MRNLNVMVVGAGGREHALAWALARSPRCRQVYVAPGNGGTVWEGAHDEAGKLRRAPASRVEIGTSDVEGLLTFARENEVDLTVVGPESALAAGIVDRFMAAGRAIFGPSRAAAQLEISKSFAKQFMREHAIPTGAFRLFDDVVTARAFIRRVDGPVVVKADGLAAGKGVFVCSGADEALAAVEQIMVGRAFGAAGRRVLIEQRLEGAEISLLAWSDGRTVRPLPAARDHKRLLEGDRGPNTGGMGAYAPAPDIPESLVQEIVATVLQPAVNGMAWRGTPYVGILYAGLMLTADGPRVLEFNCRFGDPETQVVLPLLASDPIEVMCACIEGRLDQVEVRWRPESCATVVLASPGYPGTYPTGLPITGTETVGDEETLLFHAGTARSEEGLVTSGGRVLAVSARADHLPAALARAYAGAASIHFEGAHYRRDIGEQLVGVPLYG